MEDEYKKVLAKITSVDIKVRNKQNRTNLAVTIDFLLEKNKKEHVTFDFAQSNLRFFNFINILLHIVRVDKWSKLAGETVFVFYDKNSIYRICNAKDDKLFLDFQEFFNVDC
jgi:hypothetical protein